MSARDSILVLLKKKKKRKVFPDSMAKQIKVIEIRV